MSLNQFAKMAFENSMNHGFWEDVPTAYAAEQFEQHYATYLGNKLCLIHGEISEAHEELRKNTNPSHTYYRADGKPEGMQFEIVDVLIRCFDLAGALGWDLDAIVAEKAAYNANREMRHGKNF